MIRIILEQKSQLHFDMISTDNKPPALLIKFQHQATPQKVQVQREEKVGNKIYLEQTDTNFDRFKIKGKRSVYVLEVANKYITHSFPISKEGLNQLKSESS